MEIAIDRTENSSSPTPHNSKYTMGSVQKPGNSLHKFSSSSLAALQKLIGREAQMDSADHKITANLGKDNLSTNIQEAAEKFVHRWQLFSDSYPSRIKNKVETFEQLLRMTAKVVFHGKYTKCVPSETKERLRDKIQECAFKLDDLPNVLLLCLNFCDVIIDPWTKFIGTKSMTAEEIDWIWKEGWILLDERLDTLISTKMFDQAAIILEICISKGQSALKSSSQDTQEIFDPYWFPHERLLQYMIIYVFLWSRNPKYTSFRSWKSPMFREVVNYLLSSEEERKDTQHLYPQLKEWKKMKKIGSQFVREAIWVQLKRPNTDSETLTGMMDFLIEYDPVPVGENPSDIPLVKNILSRITEISSSAYLYVLADVIKKNKVGLSEQDMKAKVIEIYIRAMTIDMGSIDALKSLAEVDKHKVLEVQRQLSEKYEELAKFFPNHPATSFQFLLTAHCLCPQKHLFQSLFPETYSDSANNIMTSVPKTMNNAEELELPVSICEALATVVYHPRWKSICGWTSAQELKTLCGRFLETGVDSLIGEKELEYLNMDSDKFKNLKRSIEHDEDDGIEKGYGTKDKRKPRRVVKLSAFLNRKAKMFKTRRKNNQPDGIENRIPVPKMKRNFIRKVPKPLMRPLIRKNKDGKFNINPKHVRSKLLTNKQRIQVGRQHGNACSSIRNQKKNYRIFESSQRHLPPGYEPLEITRIDVSDPQNPKIVTITEKKKYIGHATTNIIISYQSLDQESKPMHLKEHKILAESETGKLNSFRLCKDELVLSPQNLNSIRSFRLPNLTYNDVIDAEEKWFRQLSSVNLRGLNLNPKVSVLPDPQITSELVELTKESYNLSTQLSQLQNISHNCDSDNETFVSDTSVNYERTDGVNYRSIRPSPKQFQKKQLEKLKHLMLKAYKRRLISVIENQKLALKEKQSLFLELSSTSAPLPSDSTDPGFSSQDVIVKEIVKSQSDFEPVSPTQQPRLVTPLSQIEGLSVTYITHKMARDLGRSICFSAKVSAPKQISYCSSVKNKVVPVDLPNNIPVNVQPPLPSSNIVYQSPHSSMSPSCSTMSAQTPSPDSMQCSPHSIAPDLSDDSNLDNPTDNNVYNSYPNYNDHQQCLPEDLSVKRKLSQTQHSSPLTFYNYNFMDTQENTLLGIAGGNMSRQEPYVNYTSEDAHGLNQINGIENPSLLEGPSIQLNQWYAQNHAEPLNPSSFIPGDRFPSSPQSNPLDLTNTEQFRASSSVDNVITSDSFSGVHVNKIKSPRKKGPRKRKSRSSSECVESVIDHVINNFEPGVNNCSTTDHPYSEVSEQIPILPNDLNCIKSEDGQIACNVLNENVISINQDCKPELGFNNCMGSEQIKNFNPLDQPNADVAKQLQEIIESVPVLKDPLNATAEMSVITMCNQEPNDLTHFSGNRISAMEVVLPSVGKQIGKHGSTLSLSDAGTYCNLQSDDCENTLEDLPLEPMYTDTAAVAALCDIPKAIENPVVIPLPKRRTKTRSVLRRQRRNAELFKICTRELIVSIIPCDSPNSPDLKFTLKYLDSFEVSEDTQCGNICSYFGTKISGTTDDAPTSEVVKEKNEPTVVIEDKTAEKEAASQSIPTTEEVTSGFENKLQNSAVIESPKETIEEKQPAALNENKDSIDCEDLEILEVEIPKINNNDREEVIDDCIQFELVKTLSDFNDDSCSSDDNKINVDRNDSGSDKLIEGAQLESEANKPSIIVSLEKSPPQRKEEKVEDDDDEVQIVEQIYPKSSINRRVVSNNKSAIAERLDNVNLTNMTRILNKTQCINRRRDHHIKARNYKSLKGIHPTNEHPAVNPASKKAKRYNVIVDDDDEDIQFVAEVPSKSMSNRMKKVRNPDFIKNKSSFGITRNKSETNSSFLNPPASRPTVLCTDKLQIDTVCEKTLVITIERLDLNSLTLRNIEQLNLSRNAPSRHNTRLSNKDKTNKKLHESAVDLKRRKNLEIVGDYVKKPKYFDFPQVERRNLAKKKTIDCGISNDEGLQVNENSSEEVDKCSQTISKDLLKCEKDVIQVDILEDLQHLIENSCTEKTKTQFETTETSVHIGTESCGESMQYNFLNDYNNLSEQRIDESNLDCKHDITASEAIHDLTIESTTENLTSLKGDIEMKQVNVNESEEAIQANVNTNELYQPSEEEIPGNSGIIHTDSDFIQLDKNTIPEELQIISKDMPEDSNECKSEVTDMSTHSSANFELLTENTEFDMPTNTAKVENSQRDWQDKPKDNAGKLIEERVNELQEAQDSGTDITASKEIYGRTSESTIHFSNLIENDEMILPNLTGNEHSILPDLEEHEQSLHHNLKENEDSIKSDLKANNSLYQPSEEKVSKNVDIIKENDCIQSNENLSQEAPQNISQEMVEHSIECNSTVADINIASVQVLSTQTENSDTEIPDILQLCGQEQSPERSDNFIEQRMEKLQIDLKENQHSINSDMKEKEHSIKFDLKENEYSVQSDLEENKHSLQPELKENEQSLQPDLEENKQSLQPDLEENKQSLQPDLEENKQSLQPEIKENEHSIQPDLNENKPLMQSDLKEKEHLLQPDVKENEHSIQNDSNENEDWMQPDLKENEHSLQPNVKENEHSIQPDSKENEHLIQSDLKENEHSIKSYLEENEHSLKSDLEANEHSLQPKLKENEYSLQHDLKENEQSLQPDLEENEYLVQPDYEENEQSLQPDLEENEHSIKSDLNENEPTIQLDLEENEHSIQPNLNKNEHSIQPDLNQKEHWMSFDVQVNEQSLQPDLNENEHLMQSDLKEKEHSIKSDLKKIEYSIPPDLEENDHSLQHDLEENEHSLQHDLEENEQWTNIDLQVNEQSLQPDLEENEQSLQPDLEENEYSVQPDLEENEHSLQPDLEENEHSLQPDLEEYEHSLQPDLKETEHSLQPDLEESEHSLQPDLKENEHSLQPDLEENEQRTNFELQVNEHSLQPDLEENEHSLQPDLEENEQRTNFELQVNEHSLQPDLEENEHSLQPDLEENEQRTNFELQVNEHSLQPDLEENEQSLQPDLEENEQSLHPDLEENEQSLQPDLEENEQSLQPDLKENEHCIKFDLKENERSIQPDLKENKDSIKSDLKENNFLFKPSEEKVSKNVDIIKENDFIQSNDNLSEEEAQNISTEMLEHSIECNSTVTDINIASVEVLSTQTENSDSEMPEILQHCGQEKSPELSDNFNDQRMEKLPENVISDHDVIAPDEIHDVSSDSTTGNMLTNMYKNYEEEETSSMEDEELPVLYPVSPPRKRRKKQRDFDPPPSLDCYFDFKKK